MFKTKAFNVLFIILLGIFLNGCGDVYTFGELIEGELNEDTTPMDEDNYYYEQFYFNPITGVKYTITLNCNNSKVGFNVYESEEISEKSSSGTIIYKGTTGIMAHVNVWVSDYNLGSTSIPFKVRIDK